MSEVLMKILLIGLLILTGVTVSAQEQIEEVQTEINTEVEINVEDLVTLISSGEETITEDTHEINIVAEKDIDGEQVPTVIEATDRLSGKTSLIGLNLDRKQAMLDVLLYGQLVGGIASLELLRTLEIGFQARIGVGYGIFGNLHIAKFKAFKGQGDIYLGAHYRKRKMSMDCAFLVECYGTLEGNFGDVRLGYRHTGIGNNGRLFAAFEMGYGQFLNGGGVYKQKYEDYSPNGHVTGDMIPKNKFVMNIVIGFRLSKK